MESPHKPQKPTCVCSTVLHFKCCCCTRCMCFTCAFCFVFSLYKTKQNFCIYVRKKKSTSTFLILEYNLKLYFFTFTQVCFWPDTCTFNWVKFSLSICTFTWVKFLSTFYTSDSGKFQCAVSHQLWPKVYCIGSCCRILLRISYMITPYALCYINVTVCLTCQGLQQQVLCKPSVAWLEKWLPDVFTAKKYLHDGQIRQTLRAFPSILLSYGLICISKQPGRFVNVGPEQLP